MTCKGSQVRALLSPRTEKGTGISGVFSISLPFLQNVYNFYNFSTHALSILISVIGNILLTKLFHTPAGRVPPFCRRPPFHKSLKISLFSPLSGIKSHPYHILIMGDMMNDCCDILFIATAACQIASCLNDDELGLLAADMVLLSDALGAIAVRRSLKDEDSDKCDTPPACSHLF